MKKQLLSAFGAVRGAVVSFFKYDGMFKLIALVAAVALWLFMGAQNPEKTTTYRDVEIDILTNMTGDSALSLIYADATQAAVTATAKRTTLSNVSALDFDLSVDATDIKSPGIYTLGVNASTKVSDLFIDRIVPSKIEVRLDYLVTRTFPITLKTDNKLGDGYVFGEAELSVDSVTVTGPQTELDQVAEVYAVLRLDDADTVNEELVLRYADSRGENVDSTYFRTDITKVGVKMDVYTQKTVELYADIDCTDSVFDRDMFSVSVSPSTAVVYGTQEDLKGIDRVSVGTFKTRDLSSGSFSHTAVLPEGIHSDESIEVTLNVNLGDLKDREIRVDDIRFSGLADGYKATADSIAVTVKVRSDEALTSDDLYLTFDMENIGVGTHEVKGTLGFNNDAKGDLLNDLTLRAVVTENDNNQ